MSDNIYYQPGAYGLETVAEIEYSSANYEFDTRVVWKVIGKKKFFTMRDSGCSCPTPFEDYNLGNIDPLNFAALRREVNDELAKDYGVYITPEQAQEFLKKVKDATG